MPEVTRADMLDALRERVAHLEYHRGRGPLGKRLHELDCMRAALRELEAGGWRPIESAPKDRKFLAWNGVQVFFGEYLNGKFFTSQGQDGRSATPPTHWMPLPLSPPTTSDGGGDDAA